MAKIPKCEVQVRVTVDAKSARVAMRRVYRAVDKLIRAQNEMGAAIEALTKTPVGWNANRIHVGAGAKRAR